MCGSSEINFPWILRNDYTELATKIVEKRTLKIETKS
jgi:hypothetical protein